MVAEILARVGIPCEETAFLRQPDGTFAVWGDKIEPAGSDYCEEIYEHEVVVELYENPDYPDEVGRKEFQKALKEAYAEGEILRWSCEMRVWLEDVRLFMTAYRIEHTERA